MRGALACTGQARVSLGELVYYVCTLTDVAHDGTHPDMIRRIGVRMQLTVQHDAVAQGSRTPLHDRYISLLTQLPRKMSSCLPGFQGYLICTKCSTAAVHIYNS